MTSAVHALTGTQSFLDHACLTLLYLSVELLVCQMALAVTGDREYELVLSEVNMPPPRPQRQMPGAQAKTSHTANVVKLCIVSCCVPYRGFWTPAQLDSVLVSCPVCLTPTFGQPQTQAQMLRLLRAPPTALQ